MPLHCGTSVSGFGDVAHLFEGIARRAGARDILKPVANESKPRIFQDGRDMMINAALIAVLMIVAVGATGLCTYNPGAPEQGPVQEVDAETFLDLEARGVDFPVRYPQMPEGWITNSARRAMIAQQPAPVVGWITPDGGFIQLTQTGAAPDEALAASGGQARELARTVEVAGAQAEVYAAPDERDIWLVDAGDARFLLTGAGEDREFEEIIAESLSTAPLAPQQPDAN